MAKKLIQHDPFGLLENTVSDLWRRDLQIVLFEINYEVQLLVDIDPTERLEPEQINAYQRFMKNQKKFLQDAEVAILAYYQSLCEEYRGRLGITDSDHESVPLIAELKELARLVHPTGVTFPYATTKETFGLLCDCTWEVEHGLAVRFEEGNIVEVGYQDIIL